MFLKYCGNTKDFKIGKIDFSKGPAEVPDAAGKKLLKENPCTFVQVEKAPEAKK